MGIYTRRIHYYGEKTTIHGIRQITNDSLHFLERFAWVLTFVASCYGTAVIFLASYEAYDKNPISFATETTYLNWNTTFPAVTVCQLVNPDIFTDALPKDNVYQNFISEVVFFTGACYSCSKKCPRCKTDDIKMLMDKYRKHCDGLLGDCQWNDKSFRCCDK